MRQPSLDDLTPREREVLYWLAEGKPCYESSVILGCSEATIKKHRYRIYRILEVPNAISAANFYRDVMAVQGAGRRYANSPMVESRAAAPARGQAAGPSMG